MGVISVGRLACIMKVHAICMLLVGLGIHNKNCQGGMVATVLLVIAKSMQMILGGKVNNP